MDPAKNQKSLNRWTIAFVLLAFSGFLDAAYLTIEHYRGVIVPCSIVHGCQTVTTSIYSTIAGIPISLFGSLYYLALLILLVVYFDQKKRAPEKSRGILKIPSWLTATGFLVSLFLVYLQLFVLHAICLYCMFSAIVCLCLFITGMRVVRLLRK